MNHHAADHHCHHGVGGDAERQHGNEGCLRGSVVGALWCGDALDRARAEFLGRAREPLFHRVGGKGSEHGAAAGEDAQQSAKHRSAQHRRERALEVLLGGHEPADLGAEEIAALGVCEVGHDLGDAEHAHDEGHEADAIEQVTDAERKARVAGVDVGTDQPQQHAEEDHAKRLEDRAARQDHGEHETQHHQ